MTYYDKDLGLVMCESELSLEIDALDWERELPYTDEELESGLDYLNYDCPCHDDDEIPF